MTARIRSIAAAVVVAVAALGGAVVAQRAALADQPPLVAGSGNLGGLDLSALLNRDRSDQMLQLAFDRVEGAYYKPVADQQLLDGERKALVEMLRNRKIAAPQVPVVVATADHRRNLREIEHVLSSVEGRYAKVADKNAFTQVAISGMMSGLGDPYTTYLSPSEINGLNEQLKGGNFGGIGVYIVQDQRSGAIIVDPIEGNPAIKAGVKIGDQVLAVDGKATAGHKLDEVERWIRGEKGTVVSLRLKAHNAPASRTVAVTRADVHVPSVRAKVEDGIEYIRLADFGSTSADEVRAALQDGKRANVHGYILDLRNNGGGLLDAAVDISSLFLKSGTVVSTIDRAGNKDVKDANGRALDDVTPLVILVNKYTASASEITAGALQDHRIAKLVGTKTFGKGVVQSLYQLPDNGALKITTARYVTPLGRDIQHRGIVPDVTIDQRVDLPIIDTPHDVQLEAAKKLLARETASR